MFALQYTPYVWPFVASLALCVWLAAHAWRRPRQPLFTIFGAVMVLMSVWIACYALELASATLEGKVFWASAKYLGSAPAPAMWFVLALHATRNERFLTPPVRWAIAGFSAAVIAAVFTNPLHHLYWERSWLVPGEPEGESAQGPLFWVYAAGLYFFVLASVVLVSAHARRAPAYHRAQAGLLAVGVFVPLGGRMIEDFLGLDLFPKLDNVILLLLASLVLWGIAIFRFGAFDLVHVAHDLVIRNIDAGIVVLDPSDRVVEMNPYAAELVGPSAGGAIGRPLAAVLPGWPGLASGGPPGGELAVERAGAMRWFHAQLSAIRARGPEPIGWALVLLDVTARKAAEERLAELARTDPLTGVANRRRFFELAERESARATRYERSMSIVLLDVDHFKRVNDTYGHTFGDRVLVEVAARCRSQLRASDVIARYGGEEFVCLLAECDAAAAVQTAERLRGRIELTPVESGGAEAHVTISLGVAHASGPEPVDVAELLERADRALYASKDAGRNRVTLAR
jgi:diguanylate cyclase (GGDEF)-like protein